MSPALLEKLESKVKKVLPHSSAPSGSGSGRSTPAPEPRSPVPVTREPSASSSIFKCRSGTPSSSVSSVPSTLNKPAQAGPPDPRPVQVPAPTVTRDFDEEAKGAREGSALDALRGKAAACKERLTPGFLHPEEAGSGGVPCSSQLFGMFKALACDDGKDDDTSGSELDEGGHAQAHRRRRPQGRKRVSQASTLSAMSSDQTSDDAEPEPEFDHLHRSESEPRIHPDEGIPHDAYHQTLKRHASVSTSKPADGIANFDQNDPRVQRWLRDTLGPVQLADVSHAPEARGGGGSGARRRPQPRPQAKRRPTDVPEGDEEEDAGDDEDAMILSLKRERPGAPPQKLVQELALAEAAEHEAEEGERERAAREERADRALADPLPSDTSPEEQARFRRAEVPDAEKLRVIRAEFGDIAAFMVDASGHTVPEQILAESQGSLFRGVMMVGNLHLTTHRLLFHALLPPDNMITQAPDFESVDDNEAAAIRARPNIVQAGSVTLHQSGIFTSKKRVWMELTPEMLTCYPSADEAGKVRPLFSILMTSIYRLRPQDPREPVEFYITYDGADGIRTLHFTVDNAQSSVRWRRNYEAVLFRCASERFRQSHRRDAIKSGAITQEEADAYVDDANRWTLLRCCVPLDKAELKSIGDYHSFATLVNLDVTLQAHTQVSWRPEEIATGNFAAYGDVNIEGDEDGLPDRAPANDAMPDDHPVHPDHSGPVTRVSSHSSHDSQTSTHGPVRQASTQSAPHAQNSPRGSIDLQPEAERSATVPDMRAAGRADAPKRDRSRSLMSRIMKPEAAAATSGSESDASSQHSYLNTSVPASFQRPRAKGVECADCDTGDAEWALKDNKYQFLVAILNDQAWFAEALKAALPAAHERHYVPGAEPAQMRLDVGGYDCMANVAGVDEDECPSSSSSSSEDDEADTPSQRTHKECKRERKLDAKTEPTSESKARTARAAAKTFGLRERDGIWLKRAYLASGLVPARGHIIISPKYTCFWRRARIGADIKYRFPTADVKAAVALTLPMSSITPGRHGMALKINGQPDLRFEFWTEKNRDAVVRRINKVVAHLAEEGKGQQAAAAQGPDRQSEEGELAVARSEEPPQAKSAWELARNIKLEPEDFQVSPAYAVHGDMNVMKEAADFLAPPPDMLVYPKALNEEALAYMPFVANRPWSSGGANVRLTPRRFTMLTIGSRGDVQPYIALSLRLMQDGHKCVIVTHAEFKDWVEGYGIEHRQAGGDPTALMKISQDHKMLSPGFFKEALGTFRQWLDDLLNDAWDACQDADVLIESPSAMAGIHISEALGIPYFRAFTMPWTRTSLYPQAFMVPAFEMGPQFNYSTYVLFDNIMWKASARQINRWRKKRLGLGSTDQSSLSVSKVPFLYNFSPAVVPKPLDWYDDITITGYWELENSDMEWSPPDDLLAFMQRAKDDKKPLVYIGFGSIVVPDPAAVSRGIIKGVEKAGVRAIIAKGWSARSETTGEKEEDDVRFPASCYSVDKIPHGWLFPKIDAAMHHGGAGTTGASLRNGLPTIIKPWFGDQHFWALRVTKMGCGVKLASLKSDEIADALRKVTGDRIMIEKSHNIGARIRQERGTDTAVQAIHANIIRAAKDRQKLKKEDDVVKEHRRGTLNLKLM